MFSPDDKASRQNNRFMGKTLKPRNPFADFDIMKKGSAHATPKRVKHQKRQIENELMAADVDNDPEFANPHNDPSYENFLDHGDVSRKPYEGFFEGYDDFDPFFMDGRELEEDLFRDDLYGNSCHDDFVDRGLRLAA